MEGLWQDGKEKGGGEERDCRNVVSSLIKQQMIITFERLLESNKQALK